MTKKIIRLPQVREKTGLSRSSIYAFMKERKFPLAFPLSENGRSVGWLEKSIDDWIDSKSNKNFESPREISLPTKY